MHVESHDAHRDRNGHLTDDQLMETYFLSEEIPHLDVCRSCRSRYDEMARALEQMHQGATEEADAVFTPDRLHEQRDRVLRRLERQGHPADVLRFPNRFGSQHAAHRLLGPSARRWVAGAAAAGLVAGVFLGFAVDRRVSMPALSASRTETAAASRQLASARDEQTLTEIEEALMGPSRRVMELRSLDAMTIPPDLEEVSFVPR